MMTSQLFGFFVSLSVLCLWWASREWPQHVPAQRRFSDFCFAFMASILLGCCGGRLLEVLGG